MLTLIQNKQFGSVIKYNTRLSFRIIFAENAGELEGDQQEAEKRDQVKVKHK